MTISSISSATNPYQTYQTNGQNNFAQFQQDLQTIGSDLQSSNLTGAQSAFANLQQLMPNSSASNQTQNAFATDMNTLSNALSGTGNLSDAQAAYGKLQQDMQSVQGHHHHHHHKASSTSQSSDQNTGATDFQTLAQALQSGNLSGAQTAFAQLQQDESTYNPSGQVTTQPGGSSSINITT